MTFMFSDTGLYVTTWGRDSEGEQMWKAVRKDGKIVFFTASRDTDMVRLAILSDVLLGTPLSPAAFCLRVRARPPSRWCCRE